MKILWKLFPIVYLLVMVIQGGFWYFGGDPGAKRDTLLLIILVSIYIQTAPRDFFK